MKCTTPPVVLSASPAVTTPIQASQPRSDRLPDRVGEAVGDDGVGVEEDEQVTARDGGAGVAAGGEPEVALLHEQAGAGG